MKGHGWEVKEKAPQLRGQVTHSAHFQIMSPTRKFRHQVEA